MLSRRGEARRRGWPTASVATLLDGRLELDVRLLHYVQQHWQSLTYVKEAAVTVWLDLLDRLVHLYSGRSRGNRPTY